MGARMIALALVAVVAVASLSALGTYRWASAKGADVDNDGWVTALDIFQVIGSFNQAATPKTPPVRRTAKGAILAGEWSSVESMCEVGEVVLGGGYSLGSIGLNDKVNSDGPFTDGVSGLDGWVVSVYNGTAFDIDLWVTAICAVP